MKTASKPDVFRVAGTLLGFLGAATSLFMAVYMVSTTITLLRISRTESLVLQIWASSVVLIFSSSLLVCGSYFLWKRRMCKGSLVNLAGSGLLAFIYVYFTFFSQPPLLRWIGPAGHFLPIAPIASAVVGLWANKSNATSQL